ncbi:MAG: hypothetical protein LBN34_10010 [Clostridiales Family XIII bacterium]|nr:hypothetical protein [Clostridiales Family XIII bacterium]
MKVYSSRVFRKISRLAVICALLVFCVPTTAMALDNEPEGSDGYLCLIPLVVISDFGTYSVDSGDTCTAELNYAADWFVELLNADDGSVIDSANYTISKSKDGNTLITFSNEYLKTLPVGEYAFIASYRVYDQTVKDNPLYADNDSDPISLKVAIPILPIHDFGTFTVGGDGNCIAELAASPVNFQELVNTSDGSAIDSLYYTVAESVEGNTLISLSNEYLQTLSLGDYSFTARYGDDILGTSEIKPAEVSSGHQSLDSDPISLKVSAATEEAAAQTPKTGDNTFPLFALTLICVASLVLVASSVAMNRRCKLR